MLRRCSPVAGCSCRSAPPSPAPSTGSSRTSDQDSRVYGRWCSDIRSVLPPRTDVCHSGGRRPGEAVRRSTTGRIEKIRCLTYCDDLQDPPRHRLENDRQPGRVAGGVRDDHGGWREGRLDGQSHPSRPAPCRVLSPSHRLAAGHSEHRHAAGGPPDLDVSGIRGLDGHLPQRPNRLTSRNATGSALCALVYIFETATTTR